MALVQDLRQREANLSLCLLVQILYWLLVARLSLLWLTNWMRHIVEAFQQRIPLQLLTQFGPQLWHEAVHKVIASEQVVL